jgi:hypothetical protein
VKLRLPLLALTLLLAACATLPPPGCVKLGPGAMCLLAPAALPAIDDTHLVTVARDGKQDAFMGRLAIDAHTLRLAGASLFGTGLFDISYDGRTIDAQPPRAKAHAELMLAMLEITLADPAALRSHLHDLTLKVGERDDNEVRDLYTHGRLVAHIERSKEPLAKARIRIEIPAAKTSLDMLPLDRR